MPCFSARNIRFAGTQQLQARQRSGNRAKTAFRSTSEANHNEPHGSLRGQCREVWHGGNVGGARSTPKNKTLRQLSLQQKELERLKAASTVVTLEDRLDALMKCQEEEKRLQEEAESTKRRYREIDDAHRKAEEDVEGKEDVSGVGEKTVVLERAFLLKHEQEEEVKKANRIILDAKCHAVRDAQIQEKIQLQKERIDKERRIEKRVIEQAMKSLSEEDEKHEKQKELKMQYANDIKKQLNERETLRFLEAERIEEEAKLLRRAHEAIKRDDERQDRLNRERRQRFRDELAKIAEMSNFFKKMLCEQEKEAEMRVAAYMREKEQREKALLAEKKLAKEAFERKQQRLFTLAQKIIESKSQREEMSYLREQEKLEREYRRKEKEAAVRKQQIEKDLARDREKQLQERKHHQALQIARDEQDFNNLVERLKQEEVKQKKMQEEHERRLKCYRLDIMRQMGDKEMERRKLQDLERSQASAWRESQRQRDANICAVINAKLSAMRAACLPEKYIRDVEKQLQKITKVARN